MAAHVRVWMKSAPGSRAIFSGVALRQTLADIFLGRTVFKTDWPAGLMHFLMFWGFIVLLIGTSLLALHEYVTSFLTGGNHLLFEVSMEIGGLLLLAGVVWALVRRYLQRVPRLERRLEDALIPLALLVVALSGFLLEGMRSGRSKPALGRLVLCRILDCRTIPGGGGGLGLPLCLVGPCVAESGISSP